MKTKFLFLASFIFLLASTSFAQVSTGIAIQGIARDGNNTARTNTTIPFKFTIYYINSGTTYTAMTQTVSLTTDAFGVFSHVLDASNIDNTSIFNNDLFLKIEQTSPSLVISDEKLNYVPYAISASNGVPTGSIMPYMGTTAPKGWVFCNGATLPSSATALKALIGNNAPDLRGMFMRGSGTNSNSSYANNVGPNLNTIQGEGIKTHDLTVTDPGHNHAITDPGHAHSTPVSGGDDWNSGAFDNGESAYGNNATTTNTTGIQINSKVTGITVKYNSPVTETRPVNFGVNYIIKL